MFLCQEKTGRGVSHFLSTKEGETQELSVGVIPPPVQGAFGNVWFSQKLEGAVVIYGQRLGC